MRSTTFCNVLRCADDSNPFDIIAGYKRCLLTYFLTVIVAAIVTDTQNSSTVYFEKELNRAKLRQWRNQSPHQALERPKTTHI